LTLLCSEAWRFDPHLSASKKNGDPEIGLQQMSGETQRVNESSPWEKSFEFFWQSCTKKKTTASQKVLN